MWYQSSFRRNLIDMHIADGAPEYMSRFDPEGYADAVAASGVDTAIIYSGSCLGICYWPTKAGHMHAGLNGRDIFGETVQACRRRGLQVVGYYNIWNRWEFDKHPEWRMRDAQGKAPLVDYGERYGLCCPNTGYREFVRAQVTDLCGSYRFEGLWIDMIGWFGNICYCDGCRDTYRRETGYELPEKADFGDPNWIRFIRKRQEWQADFAEMITEIAKSLQPGISVTHQSTSFLNGWPGGASMSFLSKSDFLAGDFYLGPAPEAYVCKFLRSASVNHPIEFMVSRCIDLSEHTTTKSQELLTLQMLMAVSHLSSFVFIDAIDPAGTVHRPLYDRMNGILGQMDPYLPYIQKPGKQLADVALYFNPDNVTGEFSGDLSFTGSFAFPELQTAYQISESLIEANIAFDVVTPRRLTKLGRYPVLVLSDCKMLNDEEVHAFRDYVDTGGHLYASGKTGLFDANGMLQDEPLLSDVLGVRYSGDTPWEMSYMTPSGPGLPLFPGYAQDYPLCLRSKQVIIRAEETVQVLATRTMPYSDPKDHHRYAAAISNPPGVNTGEPAVTLHSYGSGKAMYSAGPLEAAEYDAQRKVFICLIQSLIGDRPLLKSAAPKPVQINVFEQENGRLLINVLNFQQELPAIPIYDLEIEVKTGGRKIKSAVFAGSGLRCGTAERDGYAKLRIPRLNLFEMIVLDFDSIRNGGK